MNRLRIVQPDGSERFFNLSDTEYMIGRDAQADIRLDSGKISRRHARLQLRGGQFWIDDCGSANGTRLEGIKIDEPVPLARGVFEVGGYYLSLAPPPAPAFTLIGVSEHIAGERWSLEPGSYMLGRSETAEISIPHASISRQHAKLTVTETVLNIEDLGSSNGCFINGEKITKANARGGQRIRFGQLELDVRGGQRQARDWRQLFQPILRLDRATRIAIAMGLASLLILSVAVTILWKRFSGHASPHGISTAEKAYEQAIANHLVQATQLLSQEKWEQANAAFREVLELDPIHGEARKGLVRTESHVRHLKIFQRAQELYQSGELTQALTILRETEGALDKSANMEALARKIREDLAAQALTDAKAACKKKNWQRCHARAGACLHTLPDGKRALQLIVQSEQAMHQARQEFTPWRPTHIEASSGLKQQYADEHAQAVALRFAAGYLDAAVALATLMPSPTNRRLAARLAKFREAKTRADGAFAAENEALAGSGWQEALLHEADILPSSQSSVFRQELRARASDLHAGRARVAYTRGAYVDARRHYEQALRLFPEHEDSQQGLAELEQRADAFLQNIKGNGQEDCTLLRDVVGMTRPGSTAHEQAQKHLSRCR